MAHLREQFTEPQTYRLLTFPQQDILGVKHLDLFLQNLQGTLVTPVSFQMTTQAAIIRYNAFQLCEQRFKTGLQHCATPSHQGFCFRVYEAPQPFAN